MRDDLKRRQNRDGLRQGNQCCMCRDSLKGEHRHDETHTYVVSCLVDQRARAVKAYRTAPHLTAPRHTDTDTAPHPPPVRPAIHRLLCVPNCERTVGGPSRRETGGHSTTTTWTVPTARPQPLPLFPQPVPITRSGGTRKAEHAPARYQ